VRRGGFLGRIDPCADVRDELPDPMHLSGRASGREPP
jgi:hypothetical protein